MKYEAQILNDCLTNLLLELLSYKLGMAGSFVNAQNQNYASVK